MACTSSSAPFGVSVMAKPFKVAEEIVVSVVPGDPVKEPTENFVLREFIC